MTEMKGERIMSARPKLEGCGRMGGFRPDGGALGSVRADQKPVKD